MTNYSNVVGLIHNMVLCNKIVEIDPTVIDNMDSEVLENDIEIFQYYIIDSNSDLVEYIHNHYKGIYFTYSNMLDCYILCVDHWGTSWNLVDVEERE